MRGVPAEPGGFGDPFGGAGHGGRVLEPALAAVQPPARVDGDEPAGRVQDVDDRPEPGVRVPHGVGQHSRHTLFGGEAEGAGGEPQRAGPGARAPVVHDLQAQGVAVQLTPRREEVSGSVRAAGGERPAHLGRGSQQHGESVGGQRGPGEDGRSGGRVGGGDQSAELRPAGGAVPGEEGGARRRLVDEGAAPHRGARTPGGGDLSRLPLRLPPRLPLRLFEEVFRDGEVGAEERAHPAAAHALAKRTAPARVSRSVRASASIPRSAARSASRSGWEAPYRRE